MARLRLPDFIIPGAPRSGTTWLYRLLERHPDIYLPSPPRPEPKFFLVEELFRRGPAWYSERFFAAAGPARVAGEKSTNYLESPAAAERIHDLLPGVKLLFILREPVARAWSNYLWSRMAGLEQEDFARALALEEERERRVPEKLRHARPHAYFSRGLYADLLAPWLARFPRAAMLFLRYEQIVAEPRALAGRIHRFLGVAPRPGDGGGLGVVNPSERRGAPPLEEATARELARRYAEPNRRLAALLGEEFEPWQRA